MTRSQTFPFDAKRTGETVTLSVDFKNLLEVGETLQSAADWTLSLKSGSGLITLVGSATVSGTKSVQRVTGGDDGGTYYLIASVVTSASQTLEQLCTLEVQDEEV